LSPFLSGLVGSTAAGFMTLLGGLPVFFFRRLSRNLYSLFLAFSAGVMVAASFFSLLLPALESSSPWLVFSGTVVGALFVHLADIYLPHEHFLKGREGGRAHIRVKGVTLLFLAMTIHNFPEGMAVAVAFQRDLSTGLSVALGIGLQNIPEGMAVALPARGLGYSAARAFLLTFLSAIAEPIGGLVGGSAALLSPALIPFLMSFAAGAMLFVVSDEIIPESHGGGRERKASFAFMAGLVLMMSLDVLL